VTTLEVIGAPATLFSMAEVRAAAAAAWHRC
jgi:hypothetical protein